jgi:hypothetical protein
MFVAPGNFGNAIDKGANICKINRLADITKHLENTTENKGSLIYLRYKDLRSLADWELK